MSNSSLVSYTQISPNKSSPRKYAITRVTIHCVVGQVTVQSLGGVFAPSSRQASSNYGIGKDGKVGMYVEEKDRSWCSSNADNDNRAVTIEVASDTYAPYKVTNAAYSALLDLVTDICRRNGKTKILWFGDKNKTLAYQPKSNEMVMTVHRWFANKSCPGDYLYNLHDEIAAEVNKRLSGGGSSASTPSTGGSTGGQTAVNYTVQVTASDLNIRTGPGTNYGSKGFIKPGVYTIVAEASGTGRLQVGQAQERSWLDFPGLRQEDRERRNGVQLHQGGQHRHDQERRRVWRPHHLQRRKGPELHLWDVPPLHCQPDRRAQGRPGGASQGDHFLGCAVLSESGIITTEGHGPCLLPSGARGITMALPHFGAR